MAGWRDLLAIVKGNEQIQAEYRARPPQACPVCGWAPLRENARGERECPNGDWRDDGMSNTY